MKFLLPALAFSSFLYAAGGEPQDARFWFTQALQAYQQRDWERANNAALKALQVNPRLADADVLLGLIATAKSQFTTAERWFRKAVALQPGNDRTHAYLGSTYLQLKRFGDADQAFHNALELNPANQSANYNLGLIALMRKRPAEALPRFEAVLRVNAGDLAALIGVFESELLLARKQAARRTAQEIETLVDPGSPELTQVATMLALHADYETALPMLERAHKAHPDSYDLSYNLALAYFHSSQYDRAAEVLQPLLTQPRRAEVYSVMGSVEEARGRPAEAVHCYQVASSSEPGSETYRFDYANALLQHQGAQAALPVFTAGVQDFPSSWRLYLGLGSSYYLAGRYEDAAQSLLKAVALKPDARLAYFLLGKAYEPATSHQAAIASTFKSYLSGGVNDPWAEYYYGLMLYLNARAERGADFSDAKLHLQRALALNPRFAEAHLQSALIAEAEGRLQDSLHSLEQAVRMDPALAAAHYRLALAYQRFGEKEKAMVEMELFKNLKDGQAGEQNAVLRSLSSQTR